MPVDAKGEYQFLPGKSLPDDVQRLFTERHHGGALLITEVHFIPTPLESR